MNIDELSKQLQAKRRTVADLARFISTRTDQNPNYTIFLGAGCSITSGIRSADELIREWRNELCPGITSVEDQKTYLKQNFGDWYDPNREYSSLFEKKYDLQRQRRMFVEKEVAGKTPSLGYAYLTALVHQNYLNTIFTTNFDDLINEAFYLYSDQRPIVCAHDSSINSITVTSKRPKIIKFHGDYLFDDLKATTRETESLEQNMKAKFSEFAKDYGLIVVGYAGADRSIMDSLTTLLKNDDYFKSGIYWCLRKNGEISEEARKLLWKEKTYFVEIDGFDELFAELYATFNNGEVLPISTMSVTRRPAEIVNRLLENQVGCKTESPILKKAREQLLKQSKRTTLVNMMLRSDQDDFISNRNERISDDELITQLEIETLISSGNYRDAIKKGHAAVESELGPAAKRNVLNLIIQGHRYLDELPEAIAVVDELISLQSYIPSHHLLKSDLLLDRAQQLVEVEKAIEVNPYFVRCYWKKGQLYKREAALSHGDEQRKAIAIAHEAVDTGIRLDPSIGNPCWRLRFELIRGYEHDKQLRDKKLDEIVQCLSAMDPHAYRVLLMRVERLSEKGGGSQLEFLLADIEKTKQQNDQSRQADFEELRLKAIATSGNRSRITEALAAAESNFDLVRHVDLAVVIATIKRRQLGLDDEAVTLMRECLRADFDADATDLLIATLVDLGKLGEAEETFDKWAHRLSRNTRDRLRVHILDGRKDFDGALSELSKQAAHTGIRLTVMQIYLMLKKEAYAEAEKLSREILEPINFALDAKEEIVNFELARKRLKAKVNTERLDKLIQFADSSATKAAIYALLGKKKEMNESVREAMNVDMTFRFEARRWPVFDEYRTDPEFMRALSA